MIKLLCSVRGWSLLTCVVGAVTARYLVPVDVVNGSDECKTTCQCYVNDEYRQLSVSAPQMRRVLYQRQPHVRCTCNSSCSPTRALAHSYPQDPMPYNNNNNNIYNGVDQYNGYHSDPQANNGDTNYAGPNYYQVNNGYSHNDYRNKDGQCCEYEEVCQYENGGGYGSKVKGMGNRMGQGMGRGMGKGRNYRCRNVCVRPCGPRPMPVPQPTRDDPVFRPVAVPQPTRDDPVFRPVAVPVPIGDDPVRRIVPIPGPPIMDDPVSRPSFRE